MTTDEPKVKRGPAPVSTEQVFLAQNQNRAESAKEGLELDEDFKKAVAEAGAATDPSRNFVQRTGAGRAIMYRLNVWGWAPVVISTNSIAQLFAAGLRAECGDCGSNICGVLPNGQLDPDPNACSGKEAVQLRRCPVCRKRVYDVDTSKLRESEVSGDPNEIADDAFGQVTPESRTRARLEEHLIYYHKTEARQFGLAAPDAQLVRAV